MNNITLLLSAACVFLGAVIMLISAIGILRLPDFYCRLSAVTKNSTLGVLFIVVGALLYFNNIEVLLKGMGIMFFIALTSPTSAYVIAKAAIYIKVPFWNKTDLTEFEMPDASERKQKNDQQHDAP